MKNEWSRKWVSSVQPRKQRKYRLNAPLHVKRKFMSANLAPALRERYGKRSMVVRKGDEARVVRGSLIGKSGPVEKVDVVHGKVYIEGLKSKKVDGSEVPRPFPPSNLQLTKLKLDDKMRQAVLERSGRQAKNAKRKSEKKGE